MQDPNLRRLIDVTHRQYPMIWNYAILPRSPVSTAGLGGRPDPEREMKDAILRNLSEDVETTSFLKIGVKVLWVDDVNNDIAPLLHKIREISPD